MKTVNCSDMGESFTALLNILGDAITYALKAKSCREDVNKWMVSVTGKGCSNHKTIFLRSAIVGLSGADCEVLCDLCEKRTNR